MQLIDTHTHLYLDDFAPDNEAVVRRAIDAGVSHMVFPNIDASTVPQMHALRSAFPDNISLAIGLHPTEVSDAPVDEQLRFVVAELARGGYVAIGEVGMDLYWDKTYRHRQMEVFRRQMQLAAEHQLPVIIHCREAIDETLEVIDSLEHVPQCIFHSFGGSIDDVEAIRRRGDHYFGINGIVTFKNSGLRSVLPAIGLDRILLETDAPYLAPVPMRGRRNESAYLIHTAAYIADALGVSNEEVARATSSNARNIFGI